MRRMWAWPLLLRVFMILALDCRNIILCFPCTARPSPLLPSSDILSTFNFCCAWSPCPSVLRILDSSPLSQVVFVVSGKELYAVSEFFGQVKGLGLGAEHGFYYKWPMERDIMAGKVRMTLHILWWNSLLHLFFSFLLLCLILNLRS